MSREDQHPTARELSALLQGEIEGTDADRILEHAEHCEHCLARVEDIWGEASPFASGVPSEMTDELATRIEGKVLAKIRRTALADEVTGFASRGLPFVFLELLRPLLAWLSHFPGESQRRES